MKGIRQEKGDSIARDYLIANESTFTNENAKETYLVFWGLLTSNMWNNNPSESLKADYKKYLESIFEDENVKSETFIPEEQALSFFWEMAFDYYNILFSEGYNENALIILKSIHRWFKPYPEARKTIGYAQCLNDLWSLLRIMQKYDELEPILEENIEVSKNAYGDNSTQHAKAIYFSASVPTMSIPERVQRIKRAISLYEVAEDCDSVFLEDMKKALNVQLMSMTGVANTENINKSSNGYYEIGDCLALLTAGRGNEAIESLLYHKDAMSRKQPVDFVEYGKVVSYLIAIYIDKNDLVSAQKEIEDFSSKIDIDKLPPSFSEIIYSSAGIVAMRLKDYPKALRYFSTACKLSEQSVLSDMEYCKLLGNIGITYAELVNSDRNKYKQFLLDAKWYLDEAVTIYEEKIGPLTSNIGLTLLSNKALVSDAIGDRIGAIETYEKIVSDFANNEVAKEPWVLAVNNLSTLYVKTDQVEKAVKLLESISSNNREYSMLVKQNLALTYFTTGDVKLKKSLIEYNQMCYNNCLDVFNFFTIAEREAFWTMNARELLVINNLIADKYPNLTDVAYDNLLFVKNLKLMSSDILKSVVEDSSNPDLIRRYNKISYFRDAISYRSNETDSIEIWQDQMKKEERSLLGLVPDYKERLMGAFHKWNEIKEALK